MGLLVGLQYRTPKKEQEVFLILECAGYTQSSVYGHPNFLFSCKLQPTFLIARFLNDPP